MTSDVSCHAPFASMYLDQHGFVRACCMNEAHVLGNIRNDSLLDVWRGERAGRLRRAMEAHDLSLGCDFCRWPIEDGRPDLAFARWFNELPVDPEPAWPSQLEISVSNTCNLQCVMCNGEWSSSIRSQREGLAPLRKVYDDAFFEGLRDFLPHLQKVKFLGGEPFLAAETLRIMEMMVEVGATARCHVTTNGTQWSPRVERILEMLPVDITVSLDAVSKPTYESIRVGSTWEGARENLDRFRTTARRRGTHVSITMCLMTVNWHEFADFCLLADSLDISCDVNTVTQPTPLSLYHLSASDLEAVVAGLDAADREHGADFGWSRGTWKAELERLRSHLADRRAGVSVMGIDVSQDQQVTIRPWDRGDEMRQAAEQEAAEQTEATGPEADAPEAVAVPAAGGEAPPVRVDIDARRVAALGTDSHRVLLDRSDRVASADTQVLGIPRGEIEGRPASELMEIFGTHLSRVVAVEHGPGEDDDRTLVATLADGRRIRVFTTPALDGGQKVGTEVHLAWADPP